MAPAKGLIELSIPSYPVETKLTHGRRRVPTPLSTFEKDLTQINRKLKQLGCSVMLATLRLTLWPRHRRADRAAPAMAACEQGRADRDATLHRAVLLQGDTTLWGPHSLDTNSH